MISIKSAQLKPFYNGTVFSYSVYKQAKVLDKLIKSSSSKLKSQSSSSKLPKHGFPCPPAQEISRKMAILNKTYMTQISQIMAFGKNSSRLQGLGIEITKVRVDENLKIVKVYWMARNNENDNAKIAGILQSTTGELQHEINSLGFMGKCPSILFVKDVTTENYAKVIAILDSLDLEGHDEVSHPLLNLNVKEEQQIHPPMTHSIFGLNHSRITEKIKAEVKKKKAIDLKSSDKPPSEKDSKFSDHNRDNKNSTHLIPFDKALFRKFYMKQMNKRRKLLKNSHPHQYSYNESDNSDDNNNADIDCDEIWYKNEEKNN